MSKKIKTMTVTIAGGGTATSTVENGVIKMTVTRGYRETPEERRERIQSGPKARKFESKARKGSRADKKRQAIRSGW